MNRVAIFLSITLGCIAGFGCAQWLLRSPVFHDEVAQRLGRGDLLALVDRCGIYQLDLDRKVAEMSYAAGTEDVASEDALSVLVANLAAQLNASGQRVSRGELSRRMSLLRFQFGSEKSWNATLHGSGFSAASLRQLLQDNLKTCAWISGQIGNQLSVTDEECRKFYDAHRDQFFLPERRNVAHLFMAAPPETRPELVDTKKSAIEALAARLASGEGFATLVAQNSEDDATKLRGGELGYFSEKRMPPDFVEAASKLRPSEISRPIRTRLGFHILKLIDIQPAREQTFDEVRADIATEISNQKREFAIQKLSADLLASASYLRRF